MEGQKLERYIVGRKGRRYLLHMTEAKYEHLQQIAELNHKSLNRQLNELIDFGLQIQMGNETQRTSVSPS